MQIPENTNDLFGAQPAQSMNRSADQVRQSCRPYVDAGRVSDEGLESIVRLFNVPMLIFNPAQSAVISATSSLSSAMIGDAPQASTILAQSFTVT